MIYRTYADAPPSVRRFLGPERDLFSPCPGDPRFRLHDCVVRRKSARSEREAPPMRNGAQERWLGSIDEFVEVVPGVWAARVLWLNESKTAKRRVLRTTVRLRDLEQSDAWMRRVGIRGETE